MGNEIEIEITDWDTKYNPKKNQKTYTWAKINIDIIDGHDYFGLDHTERYIFVTFVCLSTKKGANKFYLNLEWFMSVTGISAEKIKSSMEKLYKKKLIGNHNTAQMELPENPPVLTGEDRGAPEKTSPTDGRTDGSNGRTDVEFNTGENKNNSPAFQVDLPDTPCLSADEVSSRLNSVLKKLGNEPELDPENFTRPISGLDLSAQEAIA